MKNVTAHNDLFASLIPSEPTPQNTQFDFDDLIRQNSKNSVGVEEITVPQTVMEQMEEECKSPK